jgi:general secretion pathway protein B
MSLILEALKKSEQQRRLGEAPTLGSPALASRRRRSVLPLLAALIVIALGVGGWLMRTPGTPGSNAPLAQTATPRPATPAAPTPPAAAPLRRDPVAAKPPGANAGIQPATAQPATSNPATATKPPEVSVNNRGQPPAHMTLPLGDRPGSVAQLPPALPDVAGPRATPPPATQKPIVSATPAAPATTPVAKPEPTPAPVTASTATPAAAAKVAPASKPAEPALPSVWELSYAIRKDLPDLTLTMHVYSDDPQQRFIVIKGERHIEGDDIGGGLILREIRPGGIVLDLKGTRFTYPRDGR